MVDQSLADLAQNAETIDSLPASIGSPRSRSLGVAFEALHAAERATAQREVWSEWFAEPAMTTAPDWPPSFGFKWI